MATYYKMTKIYLDIGANDGSSMAHYAEDSPDNIVYAFEPNPDLCKRITKKYGHLPNYHVVNKAVSDFTGNVKFNIDDNEDGCSSLLQYEDQDKLKKLWAWRDYNMTRCVRVDVVRLKNFMKENNIGEIEYLHCDAQGHDLQVLKGLGDWKDRVKYGVIEMASTLDKTLYKGQRYTVKDAITWLEANGFEIDYLQINCGRDDVEKYDKVSYLDNLDGGNEWNVYFRRVN